MATNKEMVIKVTADTSQVDSAIKQVGELRAVTEGSPIMIQYDVDGKPLDIVLEKSVNLRTESKLLFNELQKLTKEGKTQSAEFGLLSSKYNDTKSSLAAVDARSRDLFASLSLIPGPIGDIAGKLNGAIGLMKTFSSFSLKDVGNQIKGFGKDLKDIIDGFYGVEKATVETTKSTKSSADSIKAQTSAVQDNTDIQEENTDAVDEGNAATNAGTAANQKQTTVIQGLSKEEVNYLKINKDKIDNLKESIKLNEASIESGKRYLNALYADVKGGYVQEQQVQSLIREKGRLVIATQKQVTAQKQQLEVLQTERESLLQKSLVENNATKTTENNTEGTKNNTKAVVVNTGSKVADTVVTKAYTVATQAATFATNAFNLALKAIGIGFVIAIVAALVDGLIDLGKALFGTKQIVLDFEAATKKGTLALEDARNKVAEVNVAFEQAALGVITKQKALEIYNTTLGSTIGEAKTLEEAEKLFRENTANYIKSVGLRAEAQELYSLAAQRAAKALSGEDFKTTFWEDVGNSILSLGNPLKMIEKTGETMALKQIGFLKESNVLRDRANVLTAESLKLQSGYKPREVPKVKEEKPKVEKVAEEKNDNEQYEKMMQEYRDNNRAKAIFDERKRQDEELKIRKEGEERTIAALKLTDTKINGVMVTAEEKKANLLKQVREKYALEVLETNQKRVDEDLKKMQEDADKAVKLREDFLKKMYSILDDSYESETMRAKAARETKYKEDKAALEKDLEAVKASEEEKAKLLLALKVAFDRDIKKIDDDKKQKDADDRIKKLDDELRFLEMNAESSKDSFTEYWKVREQILDKSKARELAVTDLTEKQKTDIEKKYVELQKQLQREKFQAYLGYAQAGLSAVSSILSKQSELNSLKEKNELDTAKRTLTTKAELAAAEDEIKKKYFYKNRDAQAAQAAIAAAQAAISAYASLAVIPVVGPALGAIAAAAALVYGFKQVAAIRAQEYTSSVNTPSEKDSGTDSINRGKNYGDGGMIEGPLHSSQQGGVPIMAEGGEAVMTRGAVTMFRPLLSMMNQAGGGTSFTPSAMGAAKFDNPKTDTNPMEQPIIKTFVVESDLTTMQHKQARLKSLSTL